MKLRDILKEEKGSEGFKLQNSYAEINYSTETIKITQQGKTVNITFSDINKIKNKTNG